jgi:hypothetical protein
LADAQRRGRRARRPHLGPEADAAVDDTGAAAREGGEGLQHPFDLAGQLAGRGEHERSGVVGRPLPMRAAKGNEKASVLAEPVGAQATTSCPPSTSGMAPVWMGWAG